MVHKIYEEIENLLYPELRPYGRRDRDRLCCQANSLKKHMVENEGPSPSLSAILLRADALRRTTAASDREAGCPSKL